jgi:hypothetical protein
MSDVIHQYKLGGYTVRLYPNRLEVEKSSIFGKRIETILLRTITNAECGAGKALTLQTADGKRHPLSIGGKAAEEMRRQIMAAIP